MLLMAIGEILDGILVCDMYVWVCVYVRVCLYRRGGRVYVYTYLILSYQDSNIRDGDLLCVSVLLCVCVCGYL